jgi:hypothetical protein
MARRRFKSDHEPALSKRPTGTWDNLAGPPVHWSPSIRDSSGRRRQYTGFLKLRLAHSKGATYLIPEVLVGVGGFRFFLPNFFSPPILAFNVEDGKHLADLSLDIGPPRAADLERILVRVKSEDRVLSYEDGAQLYRCTFEGPPSISRLATGICQPMSNGDFRLRLYHHTTPTNATSIKRSSELWSSPWNLAGTRKLVNVAYCYFTCLPRIQGEQDLHAIAMASDGTLHFHTTSDRMIERVLQLEVYRGSTLDRTSSLGFDVPCEIIAPSHILLHPMVGVKPAYYEIVAPQIIRVGVKPTVKMRISGSEISVMNADAKRFTYVVLGDAVTCSP